MNSIVYKESIDSLSFESIIELYKDAGWTAYTNNPENLINAIKNSLYVCVVEHENKTIGLIRAVGDGLTIIYIQDILVLKDFKRKGIGKKLMLRAINKYNNVRQKVLLTEDTPETRGFYESLEFQSCDKGKLVSFVMLENS